MAFRGKRLSAKDFKIDDSEFQAKLEALPSIRSIATTIETQSLTALSMLIDAGLNLPDSQTQRNLDHPIKGAQRARY